MLTIAKKKDRFVSDSFLNYIRSLPCCICGKPSTPSHMISTKRAEGSDALAVPACIPEHHVQSTRTSREILERAGINIEELHRKLWSGFMREQKICSVVLTQEAFEELCERHGLRTPAPTTRKKLSEFKRYENPFK